MLFLPGGSVKQGLNNSRGCNDFHMQKHVLSADRRLRRLRDVIG